MWVCLDERKKQLFSKKVLYHCTCHVETFRKMWGVYFFLRSYWIICFACTNSTNYRYLLRQQSQNATADIWNESKHRPRCINQYLLVSALISFGGNAFVEFPKQEKKIIEQSLLNQLLLTIHYIQFPDFRCLMVESSNSISLIGFPENLHPIRIEIYTSIFLVNCIRNCVTITNTHKDNREFLLLGILKLLQEKAQSVWNVSKFVTIDDIRNIHLSSDINV